MKKKILLIAFFPAVFFVQQVSFAQTFCMQWTGNQMVTTCSGDFYDSGCNTGNYMNNENGYITFFPAVAGQYVTMTFVNISFADNTDLLTIYSDCGASPPAANLTYGSTLPPTIISTDPAGCLYARFISGASGISSGWHATLGCSFTTSITPNDYSFNSFISPDLNGNHLLTLTLSSPSSFALNIFSVDGKKVSQKNYSLPAGQHQLALPTENLGQGIYFVRVETENGNATKKIIKL